MSRILASAAITAALASVSPLGVAAAQSTAAAQPEARLASASKRFRDASSIKATFEQTLINPIMGTSSRARGELMRKRPNLFAITFTEPATGDRIVSDGQAVWVYLPSSAPGQVIKAPLDANAATLDPLTQALSATPAQYDMSDGGAATVGGHGVRGVRLTPKRNDAAFSKATVWLDTDDGSVRGVDITERSGLTRKVVILSMATDVTLPRSTFTFKPPKDVRVIDQQKMFSPAGAP